MGRREKRVDDHVRKLFESMHRPDVDMVNEAYLVLTNLAREWERQGKPATDGFVAMFIAIVRKYVAAELPSEALPRLISVAWGIAVGFKWGTPQDAVVVESTSVDGKGDDQEE